MVTCNFVSLDRYKRQKRRDDIFIVVLLLIWGAIIFLVVFAVHRSIWRTTIDLRILSERKHTMTPLPEYEENVATATASGTTP